MSSPLCETTPLAAELPESIEVWQLRYQFGEDAELALPGLSSHERARFHALRRHEDRVRFAATRGVLREIAGARFGLRPAEVPIEIDEHGKPFLAAPAAPSFSIAHSGELGLLALSPRHAVGVDVERVDPDLAWLEVAPRVLADDELAAIGSAPTPEALDAFYRLWVQKEAVLKARGTGFKADPRLVSVLTLAATGSGTAPALLSLDVGPSYRAALAWLP